MKEKFSRSALCLVFILGIFFTSCVKKEVVDNVVMNQAFSLPLGEKTLKTKDPQWGTSTTIPGTYGTFYYNGYPYPSNTPYFKADNQLDFQLDSLSKIDWIKRVDFTIRVKNGFPANAYLQIYLLNSNLQTVDSVFVQGKQLTKAGEVNALSEVTDTAVTIFPDAIFEGDRLARLKTTKNLSYTIYVETKREDGAVLRFSNQSNMMVNIAMRLFLNYKLNDL